MAERIPTEQEKQAASRAAVRSMLAARKRPDAENANGLLALAEQTGINEDLVFRVRAYAEMVSKIEEFGEAAKATWKEINKGAKE